MPVKIPTRCCSPFPIHSSQFRFDLPDVRTLGVGKSFIRLELLQARLDIPTPRAVRRHGTDSGDQILLECTRRIGAVGFQVAKYLRRLVEQKVDESVGEIIAGGTLGL